MILVSKKFERRKVLAEVEEKLFSLFVIYLLGVQKFIEKKLLRKKNYFVKEFLEKNSENFFFLIKKSKCESQFVTLEIFIILF